MAIVIDTPIINTEHQPITEIQLASNEPFLAGVLGQPTRFHALSRSKLYVATDLSESSEGDGGFGVPNVSLGIGVDHADGFLSPQLGFAVVED